MADGPGPTRGAEHEQTQTIDEILIARPWYADGAAAEQQFAEELAIALTIAASPRREVLARIRSVAVGAGGDLATASSLGHGRRVNAERNAATLATASVDAVEQELVAKRVALEAAVAEATRLRQQANAVRMPDSAGERWDVARARRALDGQAAIAEVRVLSAQIALMRAEVAPTATAARSEAHEHLVGEARRHVEALTRELHTGHRALASIQRRCSHAYIGARVGVIALLAAVSVLSAVVQPQHDGWRVAVPIALAAFAIGLPIDAGLDRLASAYVHRRIGDLARELSAVRRRSMASRALNEWYAERTRAEEVP